LNRTNEGEWLWDEPLLTIVAPRAGWVKGEDYRHTTLIAVGKERYWITAQFRAKYTLEIDVAAAIRALKKEMAATPDENVVISLCADENGKRQKDLKTGGMYLLHFGVADKKRSYRHYEMADDEDDEDVDDEDIDEEDEEEIDDDEE